MPDFNAIAIDDVDGWLVTDDQQRALIRFRQGSNDLALAMTPDTLTKSLNTIVNALGAFAPARMSDGPVTAMIVTWFEFGRTPDGQTILTLRVEGGGALRFALPGGMPAQMSDILAGLLGRADTAPPPGTSRQ